MAKSGKYCAAYNCTNHDKNRNFTYHQFPKDEYLRNKWIIATKRINFNPGARAILCSQHFEDDAFEVGGIVRRLKKNAIPTLFDFTPRPQSPKAPSTKKKSKKTYGQPVRNLKASVDLNESSFVLSTSTRPASPKPIQEMEDTDNICFVCDQYIPLEKWKYQLQVTATKRRNAPVADLIQELVGDEFEVLVGERDAICSKCMNLLNLMDSLTFQLGEVKSTLTMLLHSKYNLASEEPQLQVEYDNSTREDREPLHKCEVCNYQTKYEKEFNMHLRTHPLAKSPVSDVSRTVNSAGKHAVKTNRKSPKKSPAQLKSQKKKNRSATKVSREKKKKIVFQCGVCDEVFPDENEIRIHCKKKHGNDKIVVSDEEEYDDIQTLESSDEESTLPNKSQISLKRSKDSESKLDFLDDWVEDEDNDDLHSPIKKPKTDKGNKTVSLRQASMKDLFRSSLRDSLDGTDEGDKDEKDLSSQPACVFCKATFSSFEAVQDHVKLSHGDKPLSFPNHKSGLNTDPPASEGSFEIDSTTDIAENGGQIRTKKPKHKTKSYKCLLCGIKKVNLKFIKQHVKTHKKNVSLQCKKCGVIFKKVISLKVHSYKCHRVGSLLKKCSKCKFTFVNMAQLKMHTRKVHRKPHSKKHGQSKIRKSISNSTRASSNGDVSTRTPDHVNQNDLSKKHSSKTESSKISVSEVSSTSVEAGKKQKKRAPKNSDAPFVCVECNVTFQQFNRYQTHCNRHISSTCKMLGICVYCEKLFMSTEHLAVHNKTVHETLSECPTCSICKKQYTLAKDLKLHYLRFHFSENAEKFVKRVSDHKNKTIKANVENDVYNKVFKELQDLTGEGNDGEDSSLDEDNVPPLTYSCPVCDFASQDDEEVKTHLPSHVQHFCNICENIFRPEEVIKHLENHSIEFQSLKCSVCERECHDNIHLQSHMHSSHSEAKTSLPILKKNIFQCNMCEKSYITEKSLLSHKAGQHGEKTKKVLTCRECKKRFFSEKMYQDHVEFAHRSDLNCKYCDKSFENVKKLIIHEKDHLKEIKSIIKCNICGKVLKSKQALKTHRNLHKSNSSVCEVCNKSFKSYHSKREHSVIHSGNQEKKFFCEICGKGFYFYDSHTRHRSMHLDPLLFQCKTCKERFQTKSRLTEHKKKCNINSSNNS